METTSITSFEIDLSREFVLSVCISMRTYATRDCIFNAKKHIATKVCGRSSFFEHSQSLIDKSATQRLFFCRTQPITFPVGPNQRSRKKTPYLP